MSRRSVCSFTPFSTCTFSPAGVSSIPEVFQYDLTALYTDEIKVESQKSDSHAVGIPMGEKDGAAARGITRISSEGEVAVRCVLLIATDGLFDMMTNDTAVATTFKHWGNPAAAAAEMIVETGERVGECVCVQQSLTISILLCAVLHFGVQT